MPPKNALIALRRKVMPKPLRGKPARFARRMYAAARYSYPHSNLLAVGLPKSGSTWVYRMMADIPGYVKWCPESIKLFNAHHLNASDFVPGPRGYTVTKTHTPPTDHNVGVIHATQRPYVITVRDLRDVAVSWAYFVALPSRTHVTHPKARDLPLDERLHYYIREILPMRAEWVREWARRLHPQHGLIVRYEDLLADPVPEMQKVFDHYEVGLSGGQVRAIVERRSFKKETGRKAGEADAKSFNRKGVSGDWENHFTDAHRAAFKDAAQGVLEEFGWETRTDW